jgi:exoribonuclease R
MVPSDPLVTAANRALKDANVRASIRQMHAQDYPLVKMVEDLGLEDDMTAQVRQIILDLPPKAVEEIRQATLQMLDQVDKMDDTSKKYSMPLECLVTSYGTLESGDAVDVEVNTVDGQPTIRVRPKPRGSAD